MSIKLGEVSRLVRRFIVLKKSTFVVFGYLLVIFTASAEQNITTISLDVGKDELNNTNTMVSVDKELNDTERLFFGFGKSKIPSGTDTIESNLSFVGLSSKFSKNLKLTGTLESSGLKGAYTMFSTGAGIQYSQDNFYIEFAPALRRINLTTLSKKRLLTSSIAIGFKAGLFLGDNFRLTASSYSYSYSRDVSKLTSFSSARFFDVKTLLLSSGLLTKSNNIETGLDFNSFSISVGKNTSVSAIDNTSSDYIYSVIDYYFSNAWSASLLFGKYVGAPADQDNYTSMTVNYSF